MRPDQRLLWLVNIKLEGDIETDLLVIAPTAAEAMIKTQRGQKNLSRIEKVELSGIVEFEAEI